MGFLLREKYSDRWFRIHTLPGSKRHPDDEDEMAEILRRHRTVLGDIVGSVPLVLVLTGYSETPQPVLSDQWLQEHYPASQPFTTMLMDDSATYWHFFMVERNWEPFMFDALLRRIAQDTIANVAITPLDLTSVYAPYDGGADIILSSSAERDAVKNRYAPSLSPLPSGL